MSKLIKFKLRGEGI